MRSIIKNKKGAFTDLFIFMIIAFAIVLISGIFIFLGGRVYNQVGEKMENMSFGEKNSTQIVDQTIGKVNESYQSLYWISIMLIVGMILSIFLGSYLVTTKPVFFVPYMIILLIAVIIAVGISNSYETLIETPLIAETFAGFIGANFILLNLPIWISVIGVIGMVIMFIRMGSREQTMYGGM